jgi:UDP-N-acetylmuramoyl-tripeptide--D-alanyl-D-alanine ligase
MIALLSYPMYLLQLENFDVSRYLKTAYSLWSINPPKPKKPLILTTKLMTVTILAIFLTSVPAAFVARISFLLHLPLFVSAFLGFGIILSLYIYFFIPLTLATMLILPFDFFIKWTIIQHATFKMARYSGITIVGIAGSYGKTTTKEMVASVLSQKFPTIKTEGNLNTPLAIARKILKDVGQDTKFFVVEMGEYYAGDIRGICNITKPHISILTGINEAHFERLKSFQTTTDTIFEIVTYSTQKSLIVANADNETVVKNAKRYSGNRTVSFYSGKNNRLSAYSTESIRIGTNGGITWTMRDKHRTLGNFRTQLLGEYAVGTAMCAYIVGHFFGIDDESIKKGIERVKPVPHRLEPIIGDGNVLVIDDTYNGTSDGVREALEVLKRYKGRRKIFVTPGLAETGSVQDEVHRSLGKELAKSADLVILIDTTSTRSVIKGLHEAKFPKNNIFVFPSSVAAHQELQKMTKSGDVILFQNDWPEIYL